MRSERSGKSTPDAPSKATAEGRLPKARPRASETNAVIEVHAKPGLPLGMSAKAFLSNHWQKRPLLIRAMFGADFVAPIRPNDLAGLACEPYVRASILSYDPKRGQIDQQLGPFDEERFSRLAKSNWLLQVADADKWDRDVAALIDAFAFLPRWRFAGISVGYAVEGGRAGMQRRSGDVFLLQGLGRQSLRFDADSLGNESLNRAASDRKPSKPSGEWVLAAGDLLYLPPGVAQEGVALGECLSLAINLTAPSWADLLVDLAGQVASGFNDADRYQDPGLNLRNDPHAVLEQDIAFVRQALARFIQIDDVELGREFARFISRYGCMHTPAVRPRPMTAEQFAARLARGTTLVRHPFARMATRPGRRGRIEVFLAGQAFETSARLAQALGRDRIDAAEVAKCSDAERADLLKWLNLGLIGFLS